LKECKNIKLKTVAEPGKAEKGGEYPKILNKERRKKMKEP